MVIYVHFRVQNGSFGQLQLRKPSGNALQSESYTVFSSCQSGGREVPARLRAYTKGMTVAERPAIGIRMPGFMSGKKRKADDGRKTCQASDAGNV